MGVLMWSHFCTPSLVGVVEVVGTVWAQSLVGAHRVWWVCGSCWIGVGTESGGCSQSLVGVVEVVGLHLQTEDLQTKRGGGRGWREQGEQGEQGRCISALSSSMHTLC